MDEMLKLYLDKINDNINTLNDNINSLRSDHFQQVENINLKIDTKIAELKKCIDIIQQNINEVEKTYATQKNLDDLKKNVVEKEICNTIQKNAVTNQEFSYKKVIAITSCIATIVGLIVDLISSKIS